MIEFEIVDNMAARGIGQLWQELEIRADGPFFLSWAWIGSWVAEASIRLQVLIGRVDAQVVLLGLLAPSERRGRLPLGIPTASLHTSGRPDQDVITIEYNGFLTARGVPEQAEDAAIAFLFRQAGHPHELHLRNASRLYAGSRELDFLHRELVWSKPSWRVDLAALRASGRSYLDSLSANTRQQIRRSMRLYEQQGRLQITRARDVPEALAFLDGLASLHQPYWIARGEPGAFAFPFFESFQRRLIETCHEQGGVELIRVTRGDTAIGYLYNLRHRGQVYSYQSGFLFEADPKCKPGLVSHCLCIEMHEREGADVYDFMAGDNRYKANLGIPGPDMHYVVLQAPTWPIRVENGLRSLRDRFRRRMRRT